MPTTEKTNKPTVNENLKAGHPPAVKAGGMRINQSASHPSVKNTNILPDNLSRAEKQALTNNADFSHDQEQQIEQVKEEKLKEEKLKREDKTSKFKDLERNTLPKNEDKITRNVNARVFQPNKHVGN